MSGHSKWAGIKHKKAITDAKRGSSFTKLGNNITIAAKQGGGDPTLNALLRLAIEKARAANMSKETIDRAVKRGTGELGGAIVEELLFEGFGPGNTAILVEALTDNRNRTNADIRTLFNKNGGRITDGGGVAFQFTQQGVIRAEVPADRLLDIEEAIIESGAEEYVFEETSAVIYTEIATLNSVKEAVEAAGAIIDSAKIERIAKTLVAQDEQTLEKVEYLLDLLDANDDVGDIYTNLAEG